MAGAYQARGMMSFASPRAKTVPSYMRHKLEAVGLLELQAPTSPCTTIVFVGKQK